jgi:hypothetical protein
MSATHVTGKCAGRAIKHGFAADEFAGAFPVLQ